MREIKFRAWHKVDGWCGAFSVHQSGLIDYGSGWMTPKEANMVLMQYTGLKDKNGVEIYEGDVCKFYYKVNSNNKKLGIGEVVLCEYNDNEDYLVSVHYGWNINGLPLNDISDVEVIGNIYENPELLK